MSAGAARRVLGSALGAAVLGAAALASSASAVAAESPSPSPKPRVAAASPSPTRSPSSPSTRSPTRSPSPRASSPRPRPSSSSRPSTSPSGTPRPTPTPTPSRDTDSTDELTREQLAAQVTQADELWKKLTASSSSLGKAVKEMDRLSKRSNSLLQSLAEARETERLATAEAKAARKDLATVTARLKTAETAMRRWATSAYAQGAGNAETEAMIDALLGDASKAGDRMADLSVVSDRRSRLVTLVRESRAEQKRLTDKATGAEARAKAATAKITKEKKELDAVQVSQRKELERLKKAQAAEIKKAGPLAALLLRAQTPEAQAAAERLQKAMGTSIEDGVVSIGVPCSDDAGTYPNGTIPTSGLCPLWSAPGESLRPKAAAAFNALSKAYAAQTGTPICVTDSYRSLSEQYAVKASRGQWAATPGTSRHGLGLALDLCGGINSFGTPQHLWMRQNAPLYGWYHPDWAEPGGPLPEPWHWEFGG